MIAATIIPLRTVSAANMREHWASRARRVLAERRTTKLAIAFGDIREVCAYMRAQGPDARAVVHLNRLAPRKMDDDNLRGALKAVRDEIAKAIGVDDGDDRVRYDYAQEQSKRYGVHVEIRVLN